MRSLKKLAIALAVPVENLTAPHNARSEPELSPNPSLNYETRFVAARGNSFATPSISLLPIEVFETCGSVRRFLDDLQKNINSVLEQWKWFAITSNTGGARYKISFHAIPRDQSISLFAIIRSEESTYFSPVFSEHIVYDCPHQRELIPEVGARIFRWIKQTLQGCEEELGYHASWVSEDARQCVFWSYLSWIRKTHSDNVRARELARKAMRLDPYNSRAWAIYAQTLIDGMAIKWDDDICFCKSELIKAARNAQALDRKDTYSQILEANLLVANGDITSALQILMTVTEEDITTTMPRNFAGLFCEFAGELKLGEKILEPLISDNDPDIVRANGLQILGECKGLLHKYDEGINAALMSIAINRQAVPAIRTLAVNLSCCGLEDAARITWRESDKYSSPFSKDGFKAQPWQPPSYNALSSWISNAEKAAAYDE